MGSSSFGQATAAGFEFSNWMHLSVGQVDCKNKLSECSIHFSEIYKANTIYVKIRNTQSSVRQVLQVFHLSDCHFYSSQTIGRVKFRTLSSRLFFSTSGHYTGNWVDITHTVYVILSIHCAWDDICKHHFQIHFLQFRENVFLKA